MASSDIELLIQQLSKLPGLGPRSARRAVLHLLKKRETMLLPLIRSMQVVAENIKNCTICGNADTHDPCHICTDPRRDESLICVVEEVADLWALDRAHAFAGRYHILGGVLSAIDGITPDELNIHNLEKRVEQGGIKEIVLALSATVDGQTTAHVLRDRLSAYDVTISSLAHGVPVGGELDYLDDGTLLQAMRERRPVS